MSWRDVVVADELRWSARVAAARALATQETHLSTASTTADTTVDVTATGDSAVAEAAVDAVDRAWQAAEDAAEDFGLFVADRTLESGQTLDDWPALISDEADDRFYQARGYGIAELIADATNEATDEAEAFDVTHPQAYGDSDDFHGRDVWDAIDPAHDDTDDDTDVCDDTAGW